nr:MAG TPA: hypothetical protein [Caudoviricetes sp.]
MQKIEIAGLYIVKDQFFQDFPNEKCMYNKDENRPHFYALRDSHGLYWMIPMSTKVEKFRQKIQDVEAKSGPGRCFLFDIAEVSGHERAFIISEMFPITEEYILRPYTIGGAPFVIRNRTTQKRLTQKANRFLSMLEAGRVKSPINALSIREQLIG